MMKALSVLSLVSGALLAAPTPELMRKYEEVKKENDATPYRLEISAPLDLFLESARRAAEKKDNREAEAYLAKAKRLVLMKKAFREPPAASGYELKWLRRGKIHFLGVAGDTVWPHLAGIYFDAVIRIWGEVGKAEAWSWMDAFTQHLTEACVGQVSETLAAEDGPFLGAPAYAPATGEILRILVRLGRRPGRNAAAR